MEYEHQDFLKVNDLRVQYVTKEMTVDAVNGISFCLGKGKILGLVGETGAGKTTIARAILRVLPTPPARLRSGEVFLDGRNITGLSEKDMYGIRGNKITMIFQDPMTSLNPSMTIGRQIDEVIRLHNNVGKTEAVDMGKQMLEMVGIPANRYDEYPHQFSGGMRQRVVIAIALACSPDLLLADEPTTALDVTIQAQILDMMREMNQKKLTTTILITHDLGIVAEMCDQISIMYAGEIVEMGDKADIFLHPAHPYTIGLFGAIPKLTDDFDRLKSIPGLPPDPTCLPKGCKFHPRCEYATKACAEVEVPFVDINTHHGCRCLHMRRENV